VGWTVRGSNSCRWEIFRSHLYRPWDPPFLMYSRYRVIPGDRAAIPPSSAEVKERVELYRCALMVGYKVNIFTNPHQSTHSVHSISSRCVNITFVPDSGSCQWPFLFRFSYHNFVRISCFFPSITKTVFINVMMAILFYGAHYAVFGIQMSSRSIHLSTALLSVLLCLEK